MTIHQTIKDQVKDALRGMLKPVMKEEISSTIEVRQVFKVPKVGNVAGCYVQDGKITRNTAVRLIRDGLVIFEGKILKTSQNPLFGGFFCIKSSFFYLWVNFSE